MKKLFLGFMLFGISLANAQVNYPHIAPAVLSTAEQVSTFGVSDTGLDFLSITNATNYNNQFVPQFYARRASDNRFTLGFAGSINTATDTGTTPIMVFSTERRETVYPNAPTGATFPWGNPNDGLSQPILTRPLFAWNNSSTRIMTVSAQNFLGIGTSTPTAKLHTFGSIRFENLPTTTTNLYVLTADLNGNTSRQLATSLSGTGIINSCNTQNFLTKKGATDLTCSQVFDNGINIGVGTTVPAYKLDVNGSIRCTDLTTISDAKYKENITSIKDALNIINNLSGKTYSWKKTDFPEINFSDKQQYGLIAQEVEKVIPDIAYKSEIGEYSINYIAIIPILIEAVKQQQAQIVDLQEKINTNTKYSNAGFENLKNNKIISISPNPASDIITISLEIENNIQDAKILVYDTTGNVVSSLTIKERSNDISKTIQKSNFGSGVFFVNLVINGKSIDTKKIIFN